MTELYLSDLMKLGGIDPDEAVLIRHSVGDIAFANAMKTALRALNSIHACKRSVFLTALNIGWFSLAKRAEVLDFSGLIQ